MLLGTFAATQVSNAASGVITNQAETLKIVASSGDLVKTAATPCPEGKCVIYNSNAVGDYVTFSVNVPEARQYAVKVAIKKFPDRGSFQLAIKGAPNASYDGSFVNHGGPQDLYTGTVAYETLPIAYVSFGSAGTKQFRFTVVGKNSRSSGYTLGIDSIILEPSGAAPTTTTTRAPTTTTSTTARPTTTTTKAPATTTTTKAPPPTPTTFVHPGIVVSKQQLDEVKARIAAKQEPSISALNAAKSASAASTTREPRAREVVGCGSASNPDEGCSDQMSDWIAAYDSALLWYYTGNTASRDQAIRILNDWGYTLKSYKNDSTIYRNGRLQAAWAAEGFTKAAEIMRYSNSGWSAADIAQFEKMLRSTSLPLIQDGVTGTSNMNWQTSMIEGMMNIAIFTNDRALFDKSVSMWREQIKALIYMPSDGALPVVPVGTAVQTSFIEAYWHSPTTFAAGLEQETCRDMGHLALGMAGAVNAAETAYIQRIDLYGEQATRIATAMEYNVRFLNNPGASGWPCSVPMIMGDNASKMTWEIAYNHYHGVRGMSLPQTKQWISANRPTKSELHIGFETLTHGDTL